MPIEATGDPGYGLFGGLPSGPHAPVPGFSISMLLRSKLLIFAVFVVVAAMAIPCIWLFMVPEYRATATVRVSPVVSRIVFRTEDNGMVPLYQSYLNTQVSVVHSPTVLQRVLDLESVRATAWYRRDAGSLMSMLRAPLSSLERLKDDLSIRPRRNTELIDVSMTAMESADAALIVNAVVDEYKKLSDETMRESDIHRLEMLTSERAALQREIDGIVATKFNLSKRLGTTGSEELRSQLSSHLSSLEAEEERLQRELAMAQWELEILPVPSRDEDVDTVDTDGSDAEDPREDSQLRYAADVEWRGLNSGLDMARHELELARKRYGEAHPRIVELIASVDYAERMLREREAQLAQEWDGDVPQVASTTVGTVGPGSRAGLERQAQRLERQIGLLSEEIQRQRNRVAEAGDVAKDIAHYDEEIRYKRELYDAVRSRLSQLDMESKATARISVAAHAIAPTQPHRDRRILLSVMALAGALAAGLAVGYLRVSTDPRIREVSDIRPAGRIPFLGELPPFPKSMDLMADCDPAITEGVRMVRTALLARLADTGSRVVLITSSSSGAGKTSVAVMLSRSLAQVGKRTLLVEADLRRPSLSGYLKLKPSPGLAASLNGSIDDSAAIISTGVPGFDVLPAGDCPADVDSDLLANGVFSACLDRWKKSYDYVLLDSPPFLPVADSRMLAAQADGTIMVLRMAHCRRTEVVEAYAGLGTGGGTLLGTVLLGSARRRSDYGYYGGYYTPSSVGSGPLETQEPGGPRNG